LELLVQLDYLGNLGFQDQREETVVPALLDQKVSKGTKEILDYRDHLDLLELTENMEILDLQVQRERKESLASKVILDPAVHLG